MLQVQPDRYYRGQNTNHEINTQFEFENTIYQLATSMFMQEET